MAQSVSTKSTSSAGRLGAIALLAALGVWPSACTDERVSTNDEWVPDLASYAPTQSDERVILVTIDGARWQDVFEGSNPAWSGAAHVAPEDLMPQTYRLLATKETEASMVASSGILTFSPRATALRAPRKQAE